MSNPYLKYAQPSAPADDGQTAPPAAAPAAPEAANPYAQYQGAPPEQPEHQQPMELSQFQDELYKRLNDKKLSRTDIETWAESVGHMLKPAKGWEENWQIAERNRRGEHGGGYGRVTEDDGSLSADSLGAFYRGAGDMLSLNFGDELVAGGKAALGMGEGDTVGERYRNNWDLYNTQTNVDKQVNPTTRNIGQGLGLILSAGIPLGGIRKGAGLAENSLRSGGIGTLMGGVGGTGAGTPDDRFQETGSGALAGGTIGTLAPGAGQLASRAFRPIVDFAATRLGGESGAVNALARRITNDPAQMEETAQALRVAGIEPTPYDVIGQTGQDMVGAMARRQTGARGQFQQFADQTRVGLPGRVRQQARRISGDTRAPDDVVAELNTNRDKAFRTGFDPLRPQRIAVNEDLDNILRTDEGRTALRDAARTISDPDAKRAALALSQPPKPTAEQAAWDKAASQIESSGLGGSAKQQMMSQLGERPPSEPREISLDVLDKLRRSMRDAQSFNIRQGRNARAAVLGQYANTVRDVGTTSHPEYAQLLQKYGDESELANAVRTGEDFMRRGTTDEFVRDARALSNERPQVPRSAPGNFQAQPARYPDTSEAIPNTHDITYTSPNGSEVSARLTINPHDGRAVINIGKDAATGDFSGEANALGAGTMRDLAAEVKKQFPGVVELRGVRQTGAGQGRMQTMDLTEMPTKPGASERDLARIGARREVERQAGEGVSGAYRTAEHLAEAPEQQARTAALVGDEVANDLANAMRQELTVARNRIRNAPNSGSQTAMRQGDDAALEGLGIIAANPTSKLSYVRAAVRSISKAGISDRAAERIVNMAIDPAQTDRAIQMLSRQLDGNVKRARYFVRLIQEGGRHTNENSVPAQPKE